MGWLCFDLVDLQRNAWLYEITFLKKLLHNESAGEIIFEYSISRLGKRIDVVLLLPQFNTCSSSGVFDRLLHTCPSMLGFVKSFCGISDFFLKILSFQSKFPLTHALMSCKAIYF